MDEQRATGRHSFAWLNVTQFLGAVNDNVFKLLVVFRLVGDAGSDRATGVMALAGAVFVVPFLLFSAWAGKLADRFSKTDIVRWAKVAEVLVMAGGCIALAAGYGPGLWAVLFFMATQSAFFGPAKYGIVPELVRRAELSRANGSLEALTYLAIVAGTALAPALVWLFDGRYAAIGGVCVVIAFVGLAASMWIERTPAAGMNERASVFFVRDIWRTMFGYGETGTLCLPLWRGRISCWSGDTYTAT